MYHHSVILALLVSALLMGTVMASATPPPLPPNEGGKLLNLSVPTLSPGSTGTLSVVVTNPFNVSLTSVGLSFQIYRWDQAGGQNGTLASTDTWAPFLSLGGSAGGSRVGTALHNLAPSQSQVLDIQVTIPSGCPDASYFVRDAMNITTSQGIQYELLSRGFFSDSLWAKATLPDPEGAPTLNLTLLNVSGILPETSISVSSGSQILWIWAILVVAVVLAAVGGYLWARKPRDHMSRAGAKPSPKRSQAERALGKRRNRDGD